MSSDHVWFAKETTSGTPVTPSGNASVLTSFSPSLGESKLTAKETGQSRGVSDIAQGTHMPSGSLEFIAQPEQLGLILLSLLGQSTSTQIGATSAYDHAFEPNDSAAQTTLTAQLQQVRNGTTVTTNIRGLAVTSTTITFATDEYVRVSIDYVAFEEAKAGATFNDSGSTTSPAAITVAYGTALERFKFDRVTIQYGGTATKDGTTKAYTLTSSPTTLSNVESFEVTINASVEQRVFLGSRYPQLMHYGDRDVSASLTLDNETPSLTFYDKHVAGTQEPWRIAVNTVAEADTSNPYALDITLPLADIAETSFGDLSGENSTRTLDISLTGITDSSTDDDVSIHLVDTNTSY